MENLQMNRISNLLKIFAFSLLLLGLPTIASAQWGNNDYGRNRRNDNYNRRYLAEAARRVEDQSRSFRRSLDRDLDRSRYDGTRREDRINDVAEQLATAADNFEDSVDNGRNSRNSENEARTLFRLAEQIDRLMSRQNFSYNTENQWIQIRQDLQTIGDAYGYRLGNYNRRSNRDDRWDDRRNRNDDDDYRRNRDNDNRRNRRNNRFPF